MRMFPLLSIYMITRTIMALSMTTMIMMMRPVSVSGLLTRTSTGAGFRVRVIGQYGLGYRYRHDDSENSCRSRNLSPLFMGRRRRKKDGEEQVKRPRATMQVPESGVPEIAQVHPEQYEELLAEKVATMEHMIREAVVNNSIDIDIDDHQQATTIDLPPTEVFESPREGFRMRASFKIWRTGDEIEGFGAHYVMFERGDNRTPHKVKTYPMGSQLLQNLMDPVIEAIQETDELREKINDIRFLTTLAGDALITITYNRPIGDAWCDAAKILADRLQQESIASAAGVTFVGRSRKVKLIVGEDDTVNESLCVPGIDQPLLYRQTEGAFSQPNAIVCQKMLGWAYDATKQSTSASASSVVADHDLCELYCGNGCFTVALASNFRRVVATEMSKASVILAQQNLATNNINNTRVAKLNAEDFVLAYEGSRSFRRLDEAGIRIVGGGKENDQGYQNAAVSNDESSNKENDSNYQAAASITERSDNDTPKHDEDNKAMMHFDRLHTLFVDPPRAGLDETCRRLAAEFDRVVYVSCNPETLSRDLAELVTTHKVTRIAAFDQFPYTPHLEAGVVLERRK